MKKVATRSTWKNEPIDNPKRIDISLRFTNEQFLELKKGLIPQQMEDKWFIFYEDGWLHFHRSWTGFGNYKAQVVKEEDGYSINEFWAERNQEKYKNEDDNIDIETFTFLIAQGLLEVDVRKIYADRNIRSAADSLKTWSNFGRLFFNNQGIDSTAEIKSVLFGVAVGDALGVPVEFDSRERLLKQPVKDMKGGGTHNQPPGTWSDDTSLTLCLAESLSDGYNLRDIAENFIKWHDKGYWTARGDVFDIGMTTTKAILKLKQGTPPERAGGTDEFSNGNGSLMRISPLLFYLMDHPIDQRFKIIKQVSSITHGHIRSVIACFYYLEFTRLLLEQKDKFEVYEHLQIEIPQCLSALSVNPSEIAVFDRLLKENIYETAEEKIQSSGYVLHTLEASMWCLLTTNNYKDAVLKAVNLGGDTDTTGAVTGGLVGLLYGQEDIPKNWVDKLARRDDIEELADRLGERLTRPQ